MSYLRRMAAARRAMLLSCGALRTPDGIEPRCELEDCIRTATERTAVRWCATFQAACWTNCKRTASKASTRGLLFAWMRGLSTFLAGGNAVGLPPRIFAGKPGLRRLPQSRRAVAGPRHASAYPSSLDAPGVCPSAGRRKRGTANGHRSTQMNNADRRQSVSFSKQPGAFL